jgi:hypothetical protein
MKNADTESDQARASAEQKPKSKQETLVERLLDLTDCPYCDNLEAFHIHEAEDVYFDAREEWDDCGNRIEDAPVTIRVHRDKGGQTFGPLGNTKPYAIRCKMEPGPHQQIFRQPQSW